METAKLLIDGYFDHRTADNYHLTVDDLLDFPKEEQVMNDAFFAGNSSNSSPYGVDSSNFSGSGSDPQFSGDFSTDNHFPSELCIPYDDLGDLDWIPNFATDDFHSLEVLTGADTSSSETGHEIHDSVTAHASVYGSYVSVPTKSRSKFSRAAPREWSSRLQVFSPASTVAATKKEAGGAPGRKCLHCGSDKTPQWRAGPMGPKTLCNACGVRYNSGRLVPEYRPAASPTFVPEKHSNSHRKVVELRRQMEEKRYYRRQ